MTNAVDGPPRKSSSELADGDRIVLWDTAATVVSNHNVFNGRIRSLQLITSSGLVAVTVPADVQVDLDQLTAPPPAERVRIVWNKTEQHEVVAERADILDSVHLNADTDPATFDPLNLEQWDVAAFTAEVEDGSTYSTTTERTVVRVEAA
jgi:hypothetical protein